MGQDINLSEIKVRVDELEKRMNKMDTQYAVINTKLSAILWGVGTVGAALIGILMKMLFGA